MPDDRVSFAVWRDASTDPPDDDRLVLTERLEFAFYDADMSPPWCDHDFYADDIRPLNPQPSWWCDPKPPGEDALTLDDLRRVVNYADGTDRSSHDAAQTAAARFRRAIEALEDDDG